MSKISKLRESFNDRAEGFAQLATERRFLAAAFVTGLVALPFSGTFALMLLAAPAVYYGVSLGCRAAGAALKLALPSPPPAP